MSHFRILSYFLSLLSLQSFPLFLPVSLPLSLSHSPIFPSFIFLLLLQVDAPTTDNHASTSGSGSSGGSTDGRGSSSSSDDGNGCSWNGSTISGGSGCMSNNDTRSEGSQDDVSEGGTNDETNEEEYVPS